MAYKKFNVLLIFTIFLFLQLFVSCKKKNTELNTENNTELNTENNTELNKDDSIIEHEKSIDESLINKLQNSNENLLPLEQTLEQTLEQQLEEGAEINEESFESQIQELESEIQSIITAPYTMAENEEEFVENRLVSSNKNLVIMEYANEVFVPKQNNNNLMFIHKYKENVFRQYYDSEYRIIKKEIWNIKNYKDSKLLKTEEYSYDKSFFNKLSKKIITQENQKQELYWNYDKKGRITQEKEIITKDKIKNSKMQKYFYKNEDISPDYEYYENDKLLHKRVYTSNKNYSVQIFFDDNFSVISYYEDSILTKEQYYSKDQMVREKIY